jgi:hypothetical protein
MSFNRIKYDDGAYNQQLNQSVSVGNYSLGTPNNLDENCEACYPYAPDVRLQSQGNSVYRDIPLIDVDSELSGLNRPLTKDPAKLYIPKCPNSICKSGYPCGGGVNSECECESCKVRGQRPGDASLKHFKDCMAPQEYTRISNAPCTLRGTGWNRWEWLCLDPQERVEVPFDWNISSRTISKDNHRPCIPTPIDTTPAMPRGGSLPCQKTVSVCANNTLPADIQWRTCASVAQL